MTRWRRSRREAPCPCPIYSSTLQMYSCRRNFKIGMTGSELYLVLTYQFTYLKKGLPWNSFPTLPIKKIHIAKHFIISCTSGFKWGGVAGGRHKNISLILVLQEELSHQFSSLDWPNRPPGRIFFFSPL